MERKVVSDFETNYILDETFNSKCKKNKINKSKL